MRGLDLIYEWAIEQGLDACKCEIELSHTCPLEMPVLDKLLSSTVRTHLPKIIINHLCRYRSIYDFLDSRVFIIDTVCGIRATLDIRDPDFFAKLKEVLTEG